MQKQRMLASAIGWEGNTLLYGEWRRELSKEVGSRQGWAVTHLTLYLIISFVLSHQSSSPAIVRVIDKTQR